ncbi:hypothetical protein [Flavihumibacter sp. UBA7668]|uniref:hypothetical protein n=1 Tax=Flavihumibacter sp. UBA7668 TaxID=1946542 RepID=UPI0025B81EF4|nr:hypothetical protein [Flavihumibacter sp. UBA7668]
MILLGNILLLLASLFYFGLFIVLYVESKPHGDGLMGYGWAVILLNLGLILSMLLVSLLIAYKGGLNWIKGSVWTKFGWTSLVVLGSLLTTAFCALMKYEPGPLPVFFKVISSLGPAIMPPLLILSGFVLLNPGLLSMFPHSFLKWPLLLLAFYGAIGLLSGIVAWGADAIRQQSISKIYQKQQYSSNQQRMLNDIDSCDVLKNMVFILVFTDANQQTEIRNRALEKIKTHPDWQGEMIRLIHTEWAPEVFTFLASNDVDDLSRFTEPVRLGFLQMSVVIRKRIRSSTHPSHFYKGMFNWDMEQVLKTAERFRTPVVNYNKEIKEIREALNEPSEWEKPAFDCVPALDRYIRKTEQN